MLFLNLNEAIAFELDHRAFWVRGITSPPLLVAAAKDGGISLCRLSPEPSISRLSAPGKLAAVIPHPLRLLLALVEHGSGKLFVLGFDGSLMFEEPAPRLPEGPTEWMTADCQFDVGGTYLLCAATVSEDRIEVQRIAGRSSAGQLWRTRSARARPHFIPRRRRIPGRSC